MVKVGSCLKPVDIYVAVSWAVSCWVIVSLRYEVGELNVTVKNKNDAQNKTIKTGPSV